MSFVRMYWKNLFERVLSLAVEFSTSAHTCVSSSLHVCSAVLLVRAPLVTSV